MNTISADLLDSLQQKTLALAGVSQAAALVQQLARTGKLDEPGFSASLNSIVVTNPDTAADVFGGVNGVKVGLATLIQQLGNTPQEKDAEVTRYVASILGLERKLASQPKRMNELGQRIDNIQRQQAHMDLFSSQMLHNLASVYSDAVSPVGPKIQVAGNPMLLKQANNQDKVRALLLAGVRAAVLWRQLGGKRRQILFNRRKILSSARMLLGTVQPTQ